MYNLSRGDKKLLGTLKQVIGKLQRKVDQLQSLDEISCLLCQEQSLDNILHAAVNKLSLLTDSDKVSIMLREKDSDQLVIQAAKGLREDIIRSTSLKLGEGVAGRTLKGGKPIIHSTKIKTTNHSWFRTNSGRGYTSHCFISMPIVGRYDVAGTINVTNRRGTETYPWDEIIIIGIFANLIATLTENNRLEQRLSHLEEELALAKKMKTDSNQPIRIEPSITDTLHEINNYFGIVIGRIKLLLRGIGSEDFTRELRSMDKELGHCTFALENLLHVTNSVSHKRQDANSKQTPVHSLTRK